MKVLGVFFLVMLFFVVWLVFTPVYFLADVGECIDGFLDKKIDDLFEES